MPWVFYILILIKQHAIFCHGKKIACSICNPPFDNGGLRWYTETTWACTFRPPHHTILSKNSVARNINLGNWKNFGKFLTRVVTANCSSGLSGSQQQFHRCPHFPIKLRASSSCRKCTYFFQHMPFFLIYIKILTNMGYLMFLTQVTLLATRAMSLQCWNKHSNLN